MGMHQVNSQGIHQPLAPARDSAEIEPDEEPQTSAAPLLDDALPVRVIEREQKRLAFLDIARGITIAFMIFVNHCDR